MHRRTIVLLFALGPALAGCPPVETTDAGAGDSGSGQDAAGVDADTHVDTGSPHDAAGRDANSDAGTPILLRTSTGEYTCTRSHDSAPLEQAQWWGEALLARGGAFYLARGSGDYYAADLNFSTITLAGVLGSTTPIVETSTTAARQPSMVEDGANFALVWSEGETDNNRLRFATVGSAGQQVVAPHDVAGTSGYYANWPRLFKTASGFALIWSSATAYDNGALKFLNLDASGNAVGQPVTIYSGSNGSLWGSAAIATGTGYAVAWSFSTPSGQAVYFVTLDASGSKNFGEKQLSHSSYAGGSPSLIVDGSGFLAAWSEYYRDDNWQDPQDWGVVQVAHLDGQGNVVGPRHLLQPSATLIKDETPLLLDLGDDVALVWAHGSITVICAGCMPDNKLQLVILDRTSLSPKSNVAEILNTEAMGGLTQPVVARQGLDFLAVYDITFHTNAWVGSGAIHCQ